MLTKMVLNKFKYLNYDVYKCLQINGRSTSQPYQSTDYLTFVRGIIMIILDHLRQTTWRFSSL